jgi:malonyl-CoA/methylmalonyl-CoA synthetase
MLLLGVRVEIQNFGRNYDLIWEKFRQKSGTRIVLSPTFWHGMMVHFKAHIATLEDEGERARYVEGFRYLRDVYVTGAMPSAGLKEFWRELRGGRPLKVLYGTTETQEIAVEGEDEYSKEVR